MSKPSSTSPRSSPDLWGESPNLFKAVIDVSSDPIYVRDTEGRFRLINAAAAAVLGASPEEVVGKRNRDFIPADVCARMDARERLVLTTGQPMTYESTGWGEAVTDSYLVTKLPLRDHTNALAGTVTIARNVTEMKSLEARLRHSQKMEAIGRLAGGIAHDFNNLLTVIMGCCTDLQEQTDALPRRFALHVDEVLRAAQRAAVLTRQLLAFSRRQVLAPRVVDLNAVVGSAERMFGRIIGEDIELRTDLAADLGAVHVDPGQIEQVLLNLVVNARDAMPHGGRLTIATANADGTTQGARRRADLAPGQYVELLVSDTGVGMDPETLSNIFEPFFTTRPQGTGLGLATVYGIVTQSGGDIFAASEPGAGATFRVLLPRHDGPVPRPELSEKRHSTGSELILLVEDEQSLRDLLARALSRAGYRVVVGATGEEALAILSTLMPAPALLITDLIMPGMNGRTLAVKVREQLPDVPVLYISGYADQAVLGPGLLGPQEEFLQKPFTPATLTQAVRALLDERA